MRHDGASEHITPYDRLAFTDVQAEALLASGDHRQELVAFFGDREYGELQYLARRAARQVLQLTVLTIAEEGDELLAMIAACEQRFGLDVAERQPVVGSDVLGSAVVSHGRWPRCACALAVSPHSRAAPVRPHAV